MKFNENLNNLISYEAGKPVELVIKEFGIKNRDIIKLASNENSLGCSKKVSKQIIKNAKNVNLYPDDSMFELKQNLAKIYDLKDENFIIGAGSDQIIEFIIHAKTDENHGILQAGVTFAMYEIYAKQTNAKTFKTPSKTHDLNQFLEIYEAKKSQIAVIFLCVPNNPLGECLDEKDIINFCEKIDKNTMIVIDGAYQEFASFKDKNKKINVAKLINKFENLIYLGTFSKVYGLGGLRIGYGVSCVYNIKNLYKLRPPFNVTNLSLFAVNAALKDQNFIEKTLTNNLKEMERFENFANEFNIKFIPSYTNFITFFCKKDSTEICDLLLKKGIILRNLKSYGLNAIRITIGKPKQNSKVLKALKELI